MKAAERVANLNVKEIPAHLWKKIKDVSLHRKLFLSIAKKFGTQTIDESDINEGSINKIKNDVEQFWTQFSMTKRYSPSHKYSKFIDKENYFQNYRKIEQVLDQYNNSLPLALATIFPEITWKPWRFLKEKETGKKELSSLGNNISEFQWWKFHSYVSSFFWDFVTSKYPSLASPVISGRKNPFISVESWYEISKDLVLEFGGKELVEYYGSLYDAIIFGFKEPEREEGRGSIGGGGVGDMGDWTKELKPWKFKNNFEYWNSMKNRKIFFEYLKKELEIKEMEDWYLVGGEEIKKHGGGYLLNHYYKGSAMAAISDFFPNFEWKIWKFKHVPKHYWENEENVRKVIETLSKELKIKELEDWYKVKNIDIINLGCFSLLEKYGGLINMLSIFYPDHPWNFRYKNSFSSQLSKSQLFIYQFVSSIFPPELKLDIHVDYLHPQLFYSNSKRPIELDVFVPALNLAFEYQGSQHYHNYYLFGDPHKSLQQRDAEKKEICKRNGITLIEIPYWIDSNVSILHLIHKKRPDISSQFFPDAIK